MSLTKKQIDPSHGITVEGKPLEQYFRDQYSNDADQERNETTRKLHDITYVKPPRFKHHGREKKPEPLPVKHLTKEEYMEQTNYAKLYDEYIPRIESWIGNFLSSNDQPHKGILTVAMLQLGWQTCKQMEQRAKEIAKRYAVDADLLKAYHASAISSRISTWLHKYPKGTYFWALIEQRPAKESKKVYRKSYEYRLFPPTIAIPPKDLHCLGLSPERSKNIHYTLPDLFARVPETRDFIDKAVPPEKKTVRLKQKLAAPTHKPLGQTELPPVDELEQEPDEQEQTVTDTEQTSTQEQVADTPEVPIEKPTPDSASPLVVNGTQALLSELLNRLSSPINEAQGLNPTAQSFDLNINVTFSFGKGKE